VYSRPRSQGINLQDTSYPVLSCFRLAYTCALILGAYRFLAPHHLIDHLFSEQLIRKIRALVCVHLCVCFLATSLLYLFSGLSAPMTMCDYPPLLVTRKSESVVFLISQRHG